MTFTIKLNLWSQKDWDNMSQNKKECPGCAMMIDEELDVCPICQYEFAETQKSKKGVFIIAAFFILIVVFYFVLR